MKTQSDNGFTLVELMVTLAVAAILLTVGIPSFQSMMRDNRLANFTNQMILTLNFARSEAIKQGGGLNGKLRVTVRKIEPNWENGWTVFLDYPNPNYGTNDNLDVNSDGKPDEIVLRQYEALPANFTLRGNNNFTNYVSFQPNGSSSNGSFAICENLNIKPSRLITISNPGRIRLGNDSDKDGIPEKWDGSEITSCTSP